ncbi:MAG: glycosyltransferase family 39 protein [Anaerolineae bacterium]
MTGRSGRTGVWLVLILLTAFAVRLWRLGADSLWYDETVTLFIAQEDLPRLTAHTAGDIHPPLYYYLQHFWLAAAGTSEFASAFFSLFWGVALVALAYRLAQDLTGSQPAAVLTALLVALSPYHLWYSQEVRMYTLGACLGVMAALPLWRWVQWQPSSGRGRGVRWLAIYALAGALGLYTLYYFAFLLAFLALWGLGAVIRLRGVQGEPSPGDARPLRLGAWCGAQVGALLLFAPWLPIAVRQVTVPPVPPWREFIPLPQVLLESWNTLSVGQSLPPHLSWPWLALTALLGVTGIAHLTREGRGRAALFLAGYVVLPVALIYLVSLTTPLYHPRYLFTYSLPFYALLAVGIVGLQRWGRRLPALALLLLVAGYGWSAWRFEMLPAYRADDHRTATQYLEQHLRPGDAVLIHAGYVYTAVAHYGLEPVAWRGRLVDYPGVAPEEKGWIFLQTGSIGGAPTLGWGDPQSDFYATNAEETRQALEDVLRRHPRLWVYRCYDTVTDPQGLMREWLDEWGTRFEDRLFSGESNLRVQGYLSRLYPKERIAEGGLTFGGSLRLSKVQAEAEEEVRRIWTTLTWQRVGLIPSDWRVSLRLYNADGARLTQTDEVPLGPFYGPGQWEPGEVVRHPMRLDLPPGTPPGTYSLRLAAYEPEAFRSIPTESGQDEATVGTVTLAEPDLRPISAAEGIPFGARFAAGVALADYRLSTTEPAPGEEVWLEILWQRVGQGIWSETPALFVQVVDEGGRLHFAEERPLGAPSRPFAQWVPGELVRTFHAFRLPADTPSGGYALILGLLDPQSRERLSVRSRPGIEANHLRLAALAVVARQPSPPPSAELPHRSGATFGGVIGLVGYSAEPMAAGPGGEITARFHWRAQAVMGADYHVFLHLTTADDPRPLAQTDVPPLSGMLPTGRWLPGEVLEDTLRLALPASLPPGAYRLLVGFYDPRTGVRLAVLGPDGRVLGDALDLGPITIR